MGQLLVGFVAMMGVIGLALRLPALAGLAVVGGGFALLGVAAAVWGVDSRDGKDWKTSRRPRRRPT